MPVKVAPTTTQVPTPTKQLPTNPKTIRKAVAKKKPVKKGR
jgi:hypothetical protein